MMRRDKEHIFKLRQQGRTYRDIEKDTGVSRATLSKWFRGITWSKHLSDEHREQNAGASKERMARMHMVRRLKLQYFYATVEQEAKKAYETFKKEPLFWAGLMIYAGEGDKRSKNLIRMSNGEFYMHRIFIDFVTTYLSVDRRAIRHALLLYRHLDEKTCRDEWAAQLALSEEVFHKAQRIKGAESKKKLQYGVGISIISSTSLKKKLLTWLSLAEKEPFKRS